MTARTGDPSAEVRIRVMKRDRFQCTYCGVPGTDAELEIDHIVAVSKGGSHHISNLTTCCRACNQKKGVGPVAMAKRCGAAVSGGLAGMFMHTFKDGRLRWQGRILSTDADICLVQLFGWFHGDPTYIEKVPKSFIYSDECRLYADREAWVNAAFDIQRREDFHPATS